MDVVGNSPNMGIPSHRSRSTKSAAEKLELDHKGMEIFLLDGMQPIGKVRRDNNTWEWNKIFLDKLGLDRNQMDLQRDLH